jgi:hypothetical protein
MISPKPTTLVCGRRSGANRNDHERRKARRKLCSSYCSVEIQVIGGVATMENRKSRSQNEIAGETNSVRGLGTGSRLGWRGVCLRISTQDSSAGRPRSRVVTCPPRIRFDAAGLDPGELVTIPAEPLAVISPQCGAVE